MKIYNKEELKLIVDIFDFEEQRASDDDFKQLIKEIKEMFLENQELLNNLQQEENIRKEVREILRKHICNPSGLKNGWHIDCWNDKDISKLNELLGILDKDITKKSKRRIKNDNRFSNCINDNINLVYFFFYYY